MLYPSAAMNKNSNRTKEKDTHTETHKEKGGEGEVGKGEGEGGREREQHKTAPPGYFLVFLLPFNKYYNGKWRPNDWLRREGDAVFSRDELSTWLSDTKRSVIKTYTYESHNTEWTEQVVFTY